MAWLLRTDGVLDGFPWAAFSSWRDGYVDKDLGFHLLLAPFTGGDLVRGAKLAAVTLGTALFVSHYLVMRLRGVRWPWLWTMSMLAGGSYFLWRIDVPRPQVLSVTLSLWAFYAVVSHRPRLLFALSWAYALSYTAPFVVVGYAVIYAVWARLRHGQRHGRLIAVATVGMVAGLVVNPYFPDNLGNMWTQVVDVLGAAWDAGGPALHQGTELLPMTTRQMLVEHLALFVPAVVALFALPRLAGRLDAELLAVMTVALLYFVLACLSKRFVEYAVPFGLWALGETIGRGWAAARDDGGRLAGRIAARPHLAAAAALLVWMGLFARSYAAVRPAFASVRESPRKGAALWLARNATRDAVIFTCDWDDAPELFFYDHANRYLVFLDPIFMFRWRPELWRRWRLIALDPPADAPALIREHFGTELGVCTRDFGRLRALLASHPDATIEYEDTTAFVFRLR